MKRSQIFLAGIVVCGAVGLSLSLFFRSHTAPVPFERAAWLNGENASSTDAPRLRMADGLVASRVLLGKPRAELEALLGPPTKTNKFKNFDLVYWLGPERGFMSIDSEWLVIRFDSTNKAVQASIVGD